MLFYATPVLHKTRFKSHTHTHTHLPLLHNFIPVTLYFLHSKSVCSPYSILGSLYLVFISDRKGNLRWGHILSMPQPYRRNMKWTWSYVFGIISDVWKEEMQFAPGLLMQNWTPYKPKIFKYLQTQFDLRHTRYPCAYILLIQHLWPVEIQN